MGTTEDLAARLPSLYQSDEGSVNYSLLKLSGDELDELKEVADQLPTVTIIDESYGHNLDRIGENIQQSRGYLRDRIYRILLKARIKINISSCTINEIIEILATIFEVEKKEIIIEEPCWGSFKFSSIPDESETGEFGFDSGKLADSPYKCAHIKLTLPPASLNVIGFSRQWFNELLEEITAAGVSIELALRGTFAFSSIADEPESNEQGFNAGTLGAYFEPAVAKNLPLERG